MQVVLHVDLEHLHDVEERALAGLIDKEEQAIAEREHLIERIVDLMTHGHAERDCRQSQSHDRADNDHGCGHAGDVLQKSQERPVGSECFSGAITVAFAAHEISRKPSIEMLRTHERSAIASNAYDALPIQGGNSSAGSPAATALTAIKAHSCLTSFSLRAS